MTALSYQDPPDTRGVIKCACNIRGTFHMAIDAKDGEVYNAGWVIIWYDPEKHSGSVQKYNPMQPMPTLCAKCAILERDKRKAAYYEAKAQKATEKVQKRSWLNRLWG